jgi:hypothetical protein
MGADAEVKHSDVLEHSEAEYQAVSLAIRVDVPHKI